MNIKPFVLTTFILLLCAFSNITAQQNVPDSSLLKPTEMPDTAYVRVLWTQGWELRRSHTVTAKSYLYQALALSKKLNYANGMAKTCDRLALIFIQMGEADSAALYLLELARYEPAAKESFSYNSSMGRVYFAKRDLPNAEVYYLKALHLAEMEPDKSTLAGAYLNLGNLYWAFRKSKPGQENLFIALKMFEALDNKKGMSFCYHGIGQGYAEIREYDNALIYLFKSKQIKEQLNDQLGLSSSLNSIGIIYMDQKKYPEALDYMQQALVIRQRLQVRGDEAASYGNIGKLYKEMNDPVKANDYFAKAAVLAKELNLSNVLSFVDLEKGSMKKTKNDSTASDADGKALLLGLENAVKSGDKKWELSAYGYLGDYFMKHKDYEQEAFYLKKQQRLNDTLFNSDLKYQVKNIENKYELDKKQQEIELLKKDALLKDAGAAKNKAIKTATVIGAILLCAIALILFNRYTTIQKTKRLLEIEKLRNEIARDLHDDIGSTLSSINISGKIALQQIVSGQNDARELVMKIGERAQKMMDAISDIVWSINPHNDNMESMITRMHEYAAETLEIQSIPFVLTIGNTVSKAGIALNQRKEIYLIFKEAINNIAKYAAPANVTIRLFTATGLLNMIITDDGAGFDEATVVNGNGLRNIRARAGAIGAQLAMATAPGKGCSLTLQLPVTL